jgi:hypothetical protein
MSTAALDLLRQLDLLNAKDHPTDLARFDDKDRRTALSSYASARTYSLASEVGASRCSRKAPAALRSSVLCQDGIEDLLLPAIVYEQVCADGPLMRDTREADDYPQACKQSLGMPARRQLNWRDVASALAHFSSLAPLTRARVVNLLPISALHRPPEDRPFFFSPHGFASSVPEHIRAHVAESVVVQSVSPSPVHGGLIALEEPLNRPVRRISVRFANDAVARGGMIYFLYEITRAEKLGESRIRVSQRLDWHSPPNEPLFNAWVRQAVNNTVLNRPGCVSAEMALADAPNATYVTDSQFEAGLFALSAEKETASDPRLPDVNFLQAATPFLRASSPQEVARIRSDDPRLFEKFQAALMQLSAQLTGLEPHEFEDKAKQLYVKEIEPQLPAIEAQLSRVRFQATASALLSVAALGLALLTVGGVPFSAMLTVAGGRAVLQSLGQTLPSIGQYLQTKRGPAYIGSLLAHK